MNNDEMTLNVDGDGSSKSNELPQPEPFRSPATPDPNASDGDADWQSEPVPLPSDDRSGRPEFKAIGTRNLIDLVVVPFSVMSLLFPLRLKRLRSRLAESTSPFLIVDLRHVRVPGVVLLNILHEAAGRRRSQNGWLVIVVDPATSMEEILKVTRLHTICPIVSSREAAHRFCVNQMS